MQFLTIGSGARRALLATAASLSLCAMACGAGAQTMAPPGQSATLPAVPAMSKDDPAKVGVARQFIILFHRNSDPAELAKKLDQFLPKMAANEKKQNPKLDVVKFQQERRAMILAQANMGLDIQAHVVSRHFSMDELKQLVAFYGSPLGRKLADESPKIQMEIMAQRRQQVLSQPLPGAKPQGAPPAPAKGAAPHK